MTDILLIQLPIPQLNFAARTGNIPLAAACIKQAVRDRINGQVDILPEALATYLGDAALLNTIQAHRPGVIGFSVFNWNIDRSLYLAARLKSIYNPRIIFGGPEATPDNDRLTCNAVDDVVFGPGETALIELLPACRNTKKPSAHTNADLIFKSAPSPYLTGLLDPDIDDLVYLEGQRGCPYRCGFCYYRKSKGNVTIADDRIILDTIEWTITRGVSEICFLDPSFNARPALKVLLKQIAALNRNKNLALSGEIRAESVDAETADLYAEAGFSLFEIGLQTIVPPALDLMNRSTQLDRFLDGVHLLKERGITPRIDLIVGLPGDSPTGFRQSVEFVADHDLNEDVQVFPLSVLPGTDFRSRSRELGLIYEADPPYTVISTSSFSSQDILNAFDDAENLLDIALFPDPHLNICLQQSAGNKKKDMHRSVQIGGSEYISSLWVFPEMRMGEIAALAHRLTHPYQIIIPPLVNDGVHVCKVVDTTTSANPFTPFEVVFLEPESSPDTTALLSAIRLKRPQYLDNDLRYYYDKPGNRTVLFTVISDRTSRFFVGEMRRQVFWWKGGHLPETEDLETLNRFDGVLIDAHAPKSEIVVWQNLMSADVDNLPLIAFADCGYQRRWRRLTLADEIYDGLEG